MVQAAPWNQGFVNFYPKKVVKMNANFWLKKLLVDIWRLDVKKYYSG